MNQLQQNQVACFSRHLAFCIGQDAACTHKLKTSAAKPGCQPAKHRPPWLCPPPRQAPAQAARKRTCMTSSRHRCSCLLEPSPATTSFTAFDSSPASALFSLSFSTCSKELKGICGAATGWCSRGGGECGTVQRCG
jgi:hypothetical protein